MARTAAVCLLVGALTAGCGLLPDPAAGVLNRAQTAAKNKNWDKAIKGFSDVIRRDPNGAYGARAAYDRGNCYAQKGEWKKASTDFTMAIEINSEDPLPRHGRALAYSQLGRLDDAIADSTKAIQLAPKRAAFYCCRAGAYVKKGAFDRAIADFTKAIECEPNAGSLYHMRGLVYQIKGVTAKASDDFAKAQKLGFKPTGTPSQSMGPTSPRARDVPPS